MVGIRSSNSAIATDEVQELTQKNNVAIRQPHHRY
jgi:hypothetical protein